MAEPFRRCTLTGIGGMGLVWVGFSAAEVEAAMRSAGTPRHRRQSVSADLALMGRVVADSLNRRASASTRSREP